MFTRKGNLPIFCCRGSPLTWRGSEGNVETGGARADLGSLGKLQIRIFDY